MTACGGIEACTIFFVSWSPARMRTAIAAYTKRGIFLTLVVIFSAMSNSVIIRCGYGVCCFEDCPADPLTRPASRDTLSPKRARAAVLIFDMRSPQLTTGHGQLV